MVNRPKKYFCSYSGCGKAYNRPALLRQHERTHTNERPYVCPVEGCDKSFFRKSHLKVHQHSHQNNDEKPFQCRICGKGAISVQLLKRHELTHTQKYKCHYEGCTKAFYHYQSLRHHVDMDHKQILTCDACNRRFQRPILLTEHKMKHHGELNMEVVLCDFPGCFLTFKTSTMLQQHEKREHPRLTCEECGEVCVGQKALHTHMLIHDGGKQAKLCKCILCDGSFVNKPELVKHYHDIHGGKIPQEALDVKENGDLIEVIASTASPSLQTLMRNPTFAADVDEDDMHLPARGRPKTSNSSIVESFESVGSMIDLVLGNIKKTYVCPKKSCQRKFVRHHAYLKHLNWHKTQVENAENYLKSIENDSGSLQVDELLADLDHFSDLSDAEKVGIDSEPADHKRSGTIDDITTDALSITKSLLPETVKDNEFEKKQLELDALLSMELEKLDE